MSDKLTVWWERQNQQIRTAQIKQYPLPNDGASFVVMSNFFSVVGFGDDRVTTPEKLSSQVWLAKPWILTKFLELWSKIRPQPKITLKEQIETLKGFLKGPDEPNTP